MMSIRCRFDFLFLKVGCGPCPIGQRLAAKGARKIYGLDISEAMIESARITLTDAGLMDKFGLVCRDIFDKTFLLPEKVDCVVLSYSLTNFISSYAILVKILQICKNLLDDTGYVLIADFSWVDLPKEELKFYGMCNPSKSVI